MTAERDESPVSAVHRERIYPVTRIMGRADIEVFFNARREVEGARFRSLEHRGFEQLVLGTDAFRAPQVVSRVCGSCGVHHQLASCSAIEQATGCEVPPGAVTLREVVSWLALAQAHLQNIMFMALPDYALPMSDAGVRNITGIYTVQQEPVSRIASAQSAVTSALAALSGLAVHPALIVPGGVSSLPSEETVRGVAGELAACEEHLREMLRLVEMLVKRESQRVGETAPLEGYCMSVTARGCPSTTGDSLSLVPLRGGEATVMGTAEFCASVEEVPVSWSYLVPVTVKGHMPVVAGPLSRVNVGFGPDTPWADLELRRCREQWGAFDQDVHYLSALALEVIWGWEKVRLLLRDPELTGGKPFTRPEPAAGSGSAAVESARGTLLHSIEMDGSGRVRSYRLVSPLQFNFLEMNRRLSDVALAEVGGLEISEAAAQRLQFTVRAFSPCVSCGTH